MEHVSPSALAAMLATLEATWTHPAIMDPVAPVARPRNRDPRPFAKQPEGKARRTARRDEIAHKRTWLET